MIFYLYLACFVNTATLNMHTDSCPMQDSPSQAAYVIHILIVAASQEYVNTYSIPIQRVGL